MSSSIRVLIVVSFNVNTCAGNHWVNTPSGTLDPDTATALADYDTVIQQIDTALAAHEAEKAKAIPADHLPTVEHIHALASEFQQELMKKAQVFASAWAQLGFRLDKGAAAEEAEEAKSELRAMTQSLADLVAATVRPAAPVAAPLKFVPLPDPAEQWQAHQGPDEAGLVNLYTDEQMRAYALEFAAAHWAKLEGSQG